MKTMNKCAIAAITLGALITGGAVLLLPGAHFAVYLVIFVIASGGAMQGTMDFAAKRKVIESN